MLKKILLLSVVSVMTSHVVFSSEFATVDRATELAARLHQRSVQDQILSDLLKELEDTYRAKNKEKLIELLNEKKKCFYHLYMKAE